MVLSLKMLGITVFFVAFWVGPVNGTPPEDAKIPKHVATSRSNVLGLRYQTDAEGAASKADLRVPADPPPASGYPIVVVIHGGAWMAGDKWTIGHYADRLAVDGMATLAINYRHAPRFRYPCQVDDARSALVWIQENAAKYDLDLDRVGICGYSSGAHLALLVSMLADEHADQQQAASNWAADDPRWNNMPAIKAVCAGAAPCDFTSMPPQNQMLAYFLGGSREQFPAIYQSASPVTHASPGDPPVRLIHGDADTLVPIKSSELMLQSLLDAGGRCELVTCPRLGHATTFMSDRTPDAIAEFLKRHLMDRPGR